MEYQELSSLNTMRHTGALTWNKVWLAITRSSAMNLEALEPLRTMER